MDKKYVFSCTGCGSEFYDGELEEYKTYSAAIDLRCPNCHELKFEIYFELPEEAD